MDVFFSFPAIKNNLGFLYKTKYDRQVGHRLTGQRRAEFEAWAQICSKVLKVLASGSMLKLSYN
jgi:hypothetical protein